MEIVPVNIIPNSKDSVDIPSNLMDVYNTCIQMKALCESSNGIGLSAFQVGIPWRMFVVRRDVVVEVESDAFEYYVDCSYEPADEKVQKAKIIEGCLSIKNSKGELLRFHVERFEKVRITGKKLVSNEKPVLENVDMIIDGLSSIVFQHEIDHHNGILISEIGQAIDLR